METPRYRLDLDLAGGGERFGGRVRIELTGTDSTVRLHAKELQVERVELDGRPVPFRPDPENEQLVIDDVVPGDHSVTVVYSGAILTKGLIGLYRSPFGTSSLVTSMMYPCGARRVFPCVDDPASKAVFEVTVTCPAGSEVIFNTPPTSTEPLGDRRRVVFAPTPKMSTYVMYLGVGPFAYLEAVSGGVKLSVATPPGRERAGEFALEHAVRVLEGFDRYFGIPYPLPKLHLVTVPDFWAGAMENWGAIAFHETQLLVDPTTTSRNRRLVRETVTHEIAHQWFGNLVTMVWWNDFWLNESFATFMQAKLDSALYPGLDTWSDFLLRFPRWGFGGDVLRSTHPIDVEVRAPTELGQIADEISYGKGAAVLSMIEAFLGEEPFRRGVTNYLRKFSYANARSQDLWKSLEEAAGQPVTQIMERWVRSYGHPVVEVRQEGGELRFRQRRYLISGERTEELWPIPLTYTLDGTPGLLLLDAREGAVAIKGSPRILVNPGRRGFYRVLYSPELYDRVLAGYGQLDPVDRWSLVLDAHGFVRSGDLPLEQFERLLTVAAEHLDQLTGGEVWLDLGDYGPHLALVPRLQSAFGHYFRTALDAIGLDPKPGEAETVGLLRGRMALGRVLTDPAFAREHAAGFATFDSLNPDLRSSTVIAFARTGGPVAFESIRDRMFAAPSEEVARMMAAGIAQVRGPDSVARALDLVLDPRMPASRSWSFLNGLAASDGEPGLVWAWLRAHLPDVERLLVGTPLLSKTMEIAIPCLGATRPAEVRAYFAAHTFPEADRGIVKGLEWMEVDRRFLELHGASSATTAVAAAPDRPPLARAG
ncbi:MAG TPA: M1 family metallopeptidase [Thermoplasmata archaeon]|nr:M1 family metallopeptidase [Thermoplasmata archaeon]